MKRTLACALLALLACLPLHPIAREGEGFAQRADVKAFIAQMVERHGFAAAELERVFARVQRAEPVLAAIQPAERPAWEEYRAQFVNEARLSGGAAFWRAHRSRLARAEREFGVPAQFIVAIIGIETLYGRNMGRWRVIDALATLAFDYPPRAPFFRSELEQYLLLAREAGIDVFALRGSYAGAIGIPQFMPGSLRRYALDFDGDGTVDLRASAADALGSVANFLKQHGWRPGEPALFKARLGAAEARRFADGSVEPKVPLAEMIAAGVELAEAPPSAEALGVLVSLDGDYRVALHNFYVITRYNRSAFYAAAVCDLAEALLARVQSAGK